MTETQMTASDIVDRLAAHRTLGGAPREELAGLFVVLSGSIVILVDRGAGPHRMMEWRGGDVTGLLPYSRLVSPPGDTIAQEATTALLVAREHFLEMIRECHDVT